jgi:hypothetical protein
MGGGKGGMGVRLLIFNRTNIHLLSLFPPNLCRTNPLIAPRSPARPSVAPSRSSPPTPSKACRCSPSRQPLRRCTILPIQPQKYEHRRKIRTHQNQSTASQPPSTYPLLCPQHSLPTPPFPRNTLRRAERGPRGVLLRQKLVIGPAGQQDSDSVRVPGVRFRRASVPRSHLFRVLHSRELLEIIRLADGQHYSLGLFADAGGSAIDLDGRQHCLRVEEE